MSSRLLPVSLALAVASSGVVAVGTISAASADVRPVDVKAATHQQRPKPQDAGTKTAAEAGPDHMLVGGRSRTTRGGGHDALAQQFKSGSQVAGPWEVTRTFHNRLPRTEQPITPDGVVEITSYKQQQSNLASFVKSMRPQDLIAWWHEPEGDNISPGWYRENFVKEYRTAHAARSDVKFGMISGGYQWRDGKRGSTGDFLPPKGSVDWLGFDTYRTGTDNNFNAIVPLSQMQEFQNWYAKAKTYDVPLYITEYGRGLAGDPQAAVKRAAVLPQDYAYLKSLHFAGLVAWYSNVGPDGRDWRFTDPASLAAWKAIAAK